MPTLGVNFRHPGSRQALSTYWTIRTLQSAGFLQAVFSIK